MIRTRTTVVGIDPHAVTCLIPQRGIGPFEALALTFRGWMDARRNRGVVDTAQTHTLLWLQSRCRRREHDAWLSIEAGLARVDIELAAVDARLGDPEPSGARVPTRDEIADAGDRERAAWAVEVRRAKAANERADRAVAAKAGARVAHEQLHAARGALLTGAERVRGEWAEAYAVRAARYTRARSGRRGAAITAEPAVAAYRPAHDPAVGAGREQPAVVA